MVTASGPVVDAGTLAVLHPSLQRQLERAGIAAGRPIDHDALTALLHQIDRATIENDRHRYTLQQALDVSTEEMVRYRRQLEQHLHDRMAVESDRRTSVISALDHGLVALNSAGEVLFVNAAAMALLGGDPASGDVVLEQFELIDPRTDGPLTTERIWATLAAGDRVTATTGKLHPPTTPTTAIPTTPSDSRPVWASVTPLVEGGEITGMVLLFDDSSERNETMESLLRALQEAQRAAETKSRFLANMSHEIRTPMNGVLGMLELVAHTDLDPQQRHWITVARNSGDALLDIINEILDFSKLEAGRTELEKVTFDPAAVANDVMALLGPRAQSNGLAVSIVTGTNLPSCVVGDPGRLRQVLINLVGNAIKFTLHGSVRLLIDRIDPTTTAATTTTTTATTTAATTPSWATLRFVVEDTGTGIPTDRQEDLFAPFNQLDVSTTRTFGGTGLGLTICRETLKLMGGNITVASEVGVGSSFAFTVPVELTPCPTGGDALATTPTRHGIDDASPPHLLVAEDNAVNQILIKAILDHMGATYEVVENGRQAVDAALARPFSAVLMDCQMPMLDGFDASRRLRAAGATVPILALTANALDGDRERCIEAGMTDYLTKPLKMEQLRAALRRVNPHPDNPHPDNRRHPIERSPRVEGLDD